MLSVDLERLGLSRFGFGFSEVPFFSSLGEMTRPIYDGNLDFAN
jgi:hypothetical protein